MTASMIIRISKALLLGYMLILICTASAISQSRLITVEESIYDASNLFFKTGNLNEMDEIIEELRLLRRLNNNFFTTYWLAYTHFRAAFLLHTTGGEGADYYAVKSVQLLQERVFDNSDYYALLAMAKALELWQMEGSALFTRARHIRLYARKALSYGDDNVRAHFANGLVDLKIPSRFGGGQIVIESAEKGLRGRSRLTGNPYAPTWGARDCYWLIIQKRCGENSEKSTCRDAIEKAVNAFPGDNYFKRKAIN
jgi:hypothetical protein